MHAGRVTLEHEQQVGSLEASPALTGGQEVPLDGPEEPDVTDVKGLGGVEEKDVVADTQDPQPLLHFLKERDGDV